MEEKQQSYEVSSYFWNDDVTTKNCFYSVLSDYTFERLNLMIANPMIYNQELREISRRLYSSCGILRNTIDYMSAIMSLDFVITNYIKDDSAKAKKEAMSFILKRIKHKEIIRDIILKLCIDGTAFYYFDTTKKKDDSRKSMNLFDTERVTEINSFKKEITKLNAYVVSLPTDYCRIIGLKDNAYKIAFDLQYFNDGSETAENKLKRYPKEIQEGHAKWRNNPTKDNQCLILDNSKTIVCKISANRDEPWGRPLVLGAIKDILYGDKLRDTKDNVLDDINNQFIYQTFPEGKTPGTSSLSNGQQEEQHKAVKSAITHKKTQNGVSFVSVAAGTKINSIDINTDIFDKDYESNISTQIGTALGFAASLLNASGTTSFSAQQTNLELVSAQLFQWIEQISNELNKVINQNIFGLDYTDVEVNYLPITHINREQFFKTAKELFTVARGSLSYVAVCAGLSKDVFFAMLDEQLEEGILDKYPINATSFNTSGNNADAGRPTVEDSGGIVTNENTMRSRANDSNNQPRP